MASDNIPTIQEDHLFKMSSFPVTQAELISAIKSLPCKSSLDLKNLSMSFVKNIINCIEKPLIHIFTKSITQGIVPKDFKIAKIVPVFKSDSRTDVNNYRPISLISNFAKILEKIVHKRLLNFLSDRDTISSTQFGFRKHHSTIHPMTVLMNRAAQALNTKKHMAIIFCDLRKAFDTCNVDILLRKLSRIGVQGVELSWFRSYLSDRQQFVAIGETISDLLTICIGVPQGSILGPLLFLIYINDLPNCTEMLSLLFADDTALVMEDDNIERLIYYVNLEFRKMCTYFRLNMLSLHPDKTKYMIITSNPQVQKTQFDIYINDNNSNQNLSHLIKKICRVTTEDPVPAVKYLGVFFDPMFNFKYQIKSLSAKISRALYALRRAKNILPASALKSLYYTLMHCHFNYACEIWSCTSDSNLKILKHKQKEAVRIISKSKHLSHTEPIYKMLEILPFENILQFNKTVFIQQVIYKHAPPVFHNLWPKNRELRLNMDRELRNDDDLFLPVAKTDNISRFPFFNCPKLWNDLPPTLQIVRNVNEFKKELKKHSACFSP